VHAPGEASADPRLVAAALLEALAARGVDLRLGAEVVAAVRDGERLAGVSTADGDELRAAEVVLACGPWSGSLEWLPAELRPPVRPVKGQVVELRAPDGTVPCRRILASERTYLVPRGDGRLIVGATVEERGFDLATTAGAVHELLREAYRLLPDVAEMELVEAAAGLRPGTPDNLPLVGRGRVEGLVLATGHFRNGILLSPLTASAVADLLDVGRLPDAVAPADPARFDEIAAGRPG
jgi:glycine oxidase